MALRAVCSLQFFNCCARRKVLHRPFTRSFHSPHQRILWSCCSLLRHPSCCLKCAPRAGSVCRSFSLGGGNADNEIENGPETQLNPPDTSDTSDTNPDHSSLDHSTDDNLECISREADKTGRPPPGCQSSDSSSDSNADGRKTAAERDKSNTLDLSNLTWSDGGIVVYPNIHFGTGRDPDTKERPRLRTWKDEQAAARERKTKDHDIQSLLYNIQKSRLRRREGGEELVVRERRTTAMSAQEITELLREQNARDVVVLELPPDVDYVKYFIICSGMGTRHIGRMADNLVAEVMTSH